MCRSALSGLVRRQSQCASPPATRGSVQLGVTYIPIAAAMAEGTKCLRASGSAASTAGSAAATTAARGRRQRERAKLH